MSNHKLGWQTSDQQNKTVSCEVGFLFVSAVPADRAEVQSAFLNKLFFKKKWGKIRNPAWNSQEREKKKKKVMFK